MRLSRMTLAGAVIGMIVGAAFTLLSVFRYDPEETTLGMVVGAGLLIGVPIASVIGAVLGWLWERLFPD